MNSRLSRSIVTDLPSNSTDLRSEKAQDRAGEAVREGLLNRRGFIAAGAAFVLGCSGKHEHNHAHNKHAEKHDHTEEILAAWKQEQDMVDAIRKKDGFEGFLRDIGQSKRDDLIIPPEILREAIIWDECIDEGIKKKKDDHANKPILAIRSAGSGVVLANGISFKDIKPDDPRYIHAAAMRENLVGTEVQTTHANCGAGRKAFGVVHNLTDEELEKVPDAVIIDWNKKWHMKVIAKRQDLLLKDGKRNLADKLRYYHIPEAEMPRRPAAVHTARFVYVPLDADIDAVSPYIPLGYVASGHSNMPMEEAVEDAAACVNINMATSHGPKELLTVTNPMHIVALSHDEKLKEKFIGNMKRRQDTMPVDQKNRVIVEGAIL